MSISKTELQQLVAKLSQTSATQIHNETLLVGELHMDSIKIVELLATLSEEHGIEVGEHEAANLNTFQDLYRLTQQN